MSKDLMEELIESAKKKVTRAYEGTEETRRTWLECSLDSYKTNQHRIRVLVLEGSPVKGYIIANYGTGVVTAFTVHDKKIATMRIMDYHRKVESNGKIGDS